MDSCPCPTSQFQQHIDVPSLQLDQKFWSHPGALHLEPYSISNLPASQLYLPDRPRCDHFSTPPASILMQTCLCLAGLLQQSHFCILLLPLFLLPILNMTAKGTTLNPPLLLYFSPLLILTYLFLLCITCLLPAENKLPEGSSLCFSRCGSLHSTPGMW